MARIEAFSILCADGTRFYLDAPFHPVGLSGISLPEVDLRTVRSPFQHGQTYLGFRARERLVTLTIDLLTPDANALWQERRQELRWAINPQRGPVQLRVHFDDTTIYSLHDVHYERETGADFTTEGSPRQQRISLRFIAYDPIWFGRSNTYTWREGEIILDDLVFPATFPILFDGAAFLVGSTVFTIEGDWPTSPTFTLTGPMTNPVITNVSTGAKIGLNYSISAGETVTITTLFPYRRVTSSLLGDIFSRLTVDSQIAEFTLLPNALTDGEDSEITVNAMGITGQSNITMQWDDRWLGV